ncbi:hypothetical protein COHA_010567 [Chlorella ohadii]|uniref:NADH:flavin oxidoreductase/NADH oxidase N-terminal domain-containing protein n=1 Tax=Chlorella ohadii TaxID=2649997 RepID=A0AAD5DG38_9CHLO|nr:hypothetical protein COHA_010567 [Chlorella ohadii]
MAPLTRCRAPGAVPTPMMAEYYKQRATPGGLIISEATVVSPTGFGYPNTPGIFEPAHVDGWRQVTEAVHSQGGIMFSQLWHVGRVSHPHFQPGEALPISSSAVPISFDGQPGKVFSPKTMQMEDYPTPRALGKEEIPGIIADFRKAARNAKAAGFDGVEVHGANGYLIDQFLKDGINQRTDEYGGSIENRARLCLQIVEAVCEELGAEKVGLRLSPFGTAIHAAEDSHPYALNVYLAEELNKFGLAYLHLIEPRQVIDPVTKEYSVADTPLTLRPFREVFNGAVISAGGFTTETAAAAVGSGACDAVAFGRSFISTPDLVQRLRIGAAWNKWDRNTFYSPGPEGYLDYPTLEETEEGRALLAAAAGAAA